MFEILFYWTWRGFDLLPTYPFKGSKFHVVLSQKCFCVFQLILSFLKMGFEERKEAVKA